MIQQFLTYGNTLCSVEHATGKDTVEVFNILQLKKSKKELTISKKEQLNSKEALFQYLKIQKHVFLIVNNENILLKKVDSTINDQEKIAKSAFPNIKLSDFYYEILQNMEHSFVAICRKEYIDSVIKEYQAHGIYIIDFSLHNLAIQSLLPFIHQSEIQTSNSTLSFTEKHLENIAKSESTNEIELNINNLEISNVYVLPLCGILIYFYSNNSNYSNFKSKVEELKTFYNSYQFYSIGLKTALGVVFSILLVNFLFFSTAHSKMTALNSELLTNSSYKNTLIQLQNRVDKKLELTKSITSLSSSKTTWYLNEIGESIPTKLQLSLMDFQPLLSTIKKNNEIVVHNNTIVVKGVSNDNNSFSMWIAELELKDWIEKVVVVSYGKGKNTISEFEFLITIKN